MEFIPIVIALVAGAGVGVGGFYAYNKHNENGGKNKADDLVRKAKHEASEIVLNAKKEASEINDKALREENDRRREWKKTENRLAERDEEARRREAEEAERQAELRSRREAIYGSNNKNGYVHRPIYPYIFRDIDLDNDDVISSVETSPTYKRNKNTLRMLSQRAESKEQAPVVGEPISFNEE